MKDFIRNKLLEAIKTRHWRLDAYPERIEQSTFKTLDDKHKKIVDDNIKKLESLEFGNDKDKIGVWLYKSPIQIKHPPFKERDKGYLLLAIVNDNEMTTLYWKHRKEGEYDMAIDLDNLIEFSKSKFYDPIKKPITIRNIKAWKRSLEEPKKTKESFKKLKLSSGEVVKYYKNSNKFETIGGEPIKVDDIFDELPYELQDKVMELLEQNTNNLK
tara:strand:+ start:763 stop:1404 length:642 start_codon:yes stop_codon:yes gene_type:complete